MKRPIVNIETHLNPGAHKSRYAGGRNKFTLGECGHVLYRKISAGVPRTMRATCHHCRDLALNGGYKTRSGDGPWYRIGWDGVKGLPTRTLLDEADGVLKS